MFRTLGLCLLLLILTSCATHRKDGPPNFYVDESKIPNAEPKDEPLSKSGNMNSYNVFGKRYYVMKSSRNYEEKGIASWYGTQFHRHHTSSGERYNMLAMTAAHKTLPLPTYVQVTNLKNGKQVIVKVNDRGPFEANRIIDLSYVAAKKLGMLGHGTAYVDVKAIDPDTFNRPIEIPQIQTTNWYLQVGAFQDKSHAESLKRRLLALQSEVVSIHLAKHLYHVQIGPMRNDRVATRIRLHLRSYGLSAKAFATRT